MDEDMAGVMDMAMATVMVGPITDMDIGDKN